MQFPRRWHSTSDRDPPSLPLSTTTIGGQTGGGGGRVNGKAKCKSYVFFASLLPATHLHPLPGFLSLPLFPRPWQPSESVAS
eukprot:2718877-Pyramimonas_sp.AAC.1